MPFVRSLLRDFPLQFLLNFILIILGACYLLCRSWMSSFFNMLKLYTFRSLFFLLFMNAGSVGIKSLTFLSLLFLTQTPSHLDIPLYLKVSYENNFILVFIDNLILINCQCKFCYTINKLQPLIVVSLNIFMITVKQF